MDEKTRLELKLEKAREDAHDQAEKDASKTVSVQKEFDEWIWQKILNFRMAQFHMWPDICKYTQLVNHEKQKELKETTKKGKFTNSYGWSENRQFQFKYEIPRELENWCKNLISRYFWDESNRKKWETMLKLICRGDEPWKVLVWIKKVWGISPEQELKKLQHRKQMGVGPKPSGKLLDASGNEIT